MHDERHPGGPLLRQHHPLRQANQTGDNIAENEASSTIALENFILGFRLGMRLTVEGLLGGDDGCLADIYGEG